MSNPYLFGRIDAEHLQVPSAGRQAIPAFNLWEQLELLHTSMAWRTGVARKTLARYPEFRIDLVALAPQATIQRHANAGRISLQCLTGLVRLVTDGRTFSPGSAPALPRMTTVMGARRYAM